MGAQVGLLSTFTVAWTVTETTYITVHRPTQFPASSSSSTSDALSSTTSAVYSYVAPSYTSQASSTSSSTSTTASSGSTEPSQSPSATAASPQTTIKPPTQNSDGQKHAIIGGLSGAIAGLFMVGVLIFILLRRRHRRDEVEELKAIHEKRPTTARRWTDIMNRGAPVRPFLKPRRSTFGDEEPVIRVDTTSWPRPFVQGQGEGFRDSVPPSALRVTNPDQYTDDMSSRGVTPQPRSDTPLSNVSDTPGTFLRKQRSALVAALSTSSANRWRKHRPLPPPPPPPLTFPAQTYAPKITINRVHSQRDHRAPSVLSSGSNSIVTQQLPEDPFLSVPAVEEGRNRRPVQNAIARPFERMNSAINSLRGRSSERSRSRSSSRRSSWTVGSSEHSDPFDLESRSEPPTPNWTVYEGT